MHHKVGSASSSHAVDSKYNKKSVQSSSLSGRLGRSKRLKPPTHLVIKAYPPLGWLRGCGCGQTGGSIPICSAVRSMLHPPVCGAGHAASASVEKLRFLVVQTTVSKSWSAPQLRRCCHLVTRTLWIDWGRLVMPMIAVFRSNSVRADSKKRSQPGCALAARVCVMQVVDSHHPHASTSFALQRTPKWQLSQSRCKVLLILPTVVSCSPLNSTEPPIQSSRMLWPVMTGTWHVSSDLSEATRAFLLQYGGVLSTCALCVLQGVENWASQLY